MSLIEERLISHLSDALDVPVLMETPEVPSEDFPVWPDELVVIERVGGSKTNHLTESSFAFQSYAESLYKAVSLDERVRRAVESFYSLPDIGRVRLSSCYNHTDTRAGRYRYQSTYDIYYMDPIDLEEE